MFFFNLKISISHTQPHNFDSSTQTILGTRPKPAYGRQGLDWIVGPGYSFVVFSTNETMETNQKPQKNMKPPGKPTKNHEEP